MFFQVDIDASHSGTLAALLAHVPCAPQYIEGQVPGWKPVKRMGPPMEFAFFSTVFCSVFFRS